MPTSFACDEVKRQCVADARASSRTRRAATPSAGERAKTRSALPIPRSTSSRRHHICILEPSRLKVGVRRLPSILRRTRCVKLTAGVDAAVGAAAGGDSVGSTRRYRRRRGVGASGGVGEASGRLRGGVDASGSTPLAPSERPASSDCAHRHASDSEAFRSSAASPSPPPIRLPSPWRALHPRACFCITRAASCLFDRLLPPRPTASSASERRCRDRTHLLVERRVAALDALLLLRLLPRRVRLQVASLRLLEGGVRLTATHAAL